MAIPKISRSNVLAAIKRIRREGVPAQRQSTRYSLVYEGRRYPPKYVVSLAVEDVYGKALDPENFSGGVETNSLVQRLGFAIDAVAFSRSSKDRARAKRPGSQEPRIARVVVRGVPGNAARGERFLLEALHEWPVGLSVKFLVTPGGFVRIPFPARWSGGVGWESSRADLKVLITHARDALARTVTGRVVKAAHGKVDVVTVGIDLVRDDRPEHAELVAVYNLKKRRVFWTGKSYPTGSQERSLVQVTDLKTHTLRLGRERVLVLGCHDLNMFSPRAWANQGKHGLRRNAVPTCGAWHVTSSPRSFCTIHTPPIIRAYGEPPGLEFYAICQKSSCGLQASATIGGESGRGNHLATSSRQHTGSGRVSTSS